MALSERFSRRGGGGERSEVPDQTGQGDINAKAAKRQNMVLAAIGGVALIAAGFYIFDDTAEEVPGLQSDGSQEISISAGDLVNRNLSEREWITSSGNRLDQADRRLKTLESNNPRIRELEQEVAALKSNNQSLTADAQRVIQAYEAENAGLRSRSAKPPQGEPFRVAGTSAAPAGDAVRPAYGPSGDYPPQGALGRPNDPRSAAALQPPVAEIKVISFTGDAGEGGGAGVGGAGLQVGRPETPPVVLEDSPEYLPPNSYAPARVLVGVDAAAGVASQTDPLPVVLRITGPARSVVNRGRLLTTRIEGCIVNGAARADLPSEKVYVKLARMTCDQPGGRVAVSEVKGFLSFGGKAGVRGRVVSRDGPIVQQALIAGIVGGFGRGFAANANSVFAGPRISVDGDDDDETQLSTGDIIKGGLGQGVGDAADTVSKYLIERAEQYQPVIEMATGIDVDIVFLDGVYVRNAR